MVVSVLVKTNRYTVARCAAVSRCCVSIKAWALAARAGIVCGG